MGFLLPGMWGWGVAPRTPWGEELGGVFEGWGAFREPMYSWAGLWGLSIPPVPELGWSTGGAMQRDPRAVSCASWEPLSSHLPSHTDTNQGLWWQSQSLSFNRRKKSFSEL